jgi:acylphosphatase
MYWWLLPPVTSSRVHMIRRTVLFSGQVQGVGFRYTARNIAGRFEVAGYVKNLPDGRVEAVIEGEEDEIARFIGAVSEEMSPGIRDVKTHDSPGTGEFSRFEIRF